MNHFLLKNPKKRFTASYIIALSLIALLSIASQLIIRSVLTEQEKDARIINISGRQRMLSQKISKLALQLERANSTKEYSILKSQLKDVMHLLSTSHFGLMNRSEEMELGGENSETIKKMFEDISENFESIFKAGNSILLSSHAYEIKEDVSTILKNEGSFLKQMNTITFQYDHESTSRTKKVSFIEYVLLFITLGAIFLEAFFIFRPAVNAIDKYLRETISRGIALQDAHNNLIESKEKTESVEKELFEQLQKNHDLQVNINKDLELKINERTREIQDQKEEILQQSNELKYQNEVISKVNVKLTDNISYAKKLQHSIIGNRQSIIDQFKDGFITSKPKDIISGDFYWFYQTENLRFLVAADCTGHGVSAAFMTIIGNLLLNDIITNQKVFSPDNILNLLDMELYALMNLKNTKKVHDGMDLGLVVINSDNRTIEFSGAKRPLYFVGKDNVIEKYAGSKSTIGYNSKTARKDFNSTLIHYQGGDRIYLTSDGFQDQFGGATDTKFMQKRFVETLNKTINYPMAKQQKVLDAVFDKWKGTNTQTDDVLVIGVEL
ncbi:SpoIIE family protein phosphatase [Flammeovirga kamogawensis]|uniref:SpoIIE family protein phosphatase n=1 Tax=Flammeovirga kamogawensis TaxID=373891 RepID=A0ABX8GYY7_9BACT|nr:SpoIIE family protein phosphatase [Flammeovirga kamogawensis]MBB6459060.1 serine phosphatase RsbU (regulator of sigma subunit) [Flammeovirga kamogawensis]QWG08629.1 SpoIIE family protein phosphatase [Flammeovirga kamogawensis]TRX66922.1 SpoIIE family protein phosphatase [Flammeovirga kamogawensis]